MSSSLRADFVSDGVREVRDNDGWMRVREEGERADEEEERRWEGDLEGGECQACAGSRGRTQHKEN